MIQTGLARLVADGAPAAAPAGASGLICNPTAVDAELRHAIDLLRRAAASSWSRCSGPSTACAATRRT